MNTLKTSKKWMSVLVGGLVAVASGSAWASSHREAPAISNDPAADNTDLYAWVDRTNHVLNILANYIPLEEPSGGPNFNKFSDDVLYEVHITGAGSTDGSAYNLNDAQTYQFRFHTTPFTAGLSPAISDPVPSDGIEFFSQLTSYQQQGYTVDLVKPAGTTDLTPAAGLSAVPPNIGPTTNAVAYGITGSGTYEQFAEAKIGTLTDGTKVFAGPRDDPFYVDLGGIFDLASLRPKGTAQDGVAGYNVHVIALQIPLANLPGGVAAVAHDGTPGDDSTIGVWASASRRKVRILRNDGTESGYGPWVQVSRLGLPLINEAVIGLQDKDKWNRTTPAADLADFAGYFLFPTVVRDAKAVGIYTALGVPDATVTTLEGSPSGRLDVVGVINLNDIPTAGSHHIPVSATGDVLRVDLATDSGFPNGRALSPGTNHESVDVTDTILTLVLSGGAVAISDGVDYNDATFLSTFPYAATPWAGYNQGHGKPTP